MKYELKNEDNENQNHLNNIHASLEHFSTKDTPEYNKTYKHCIQKSKNSTEED
ncbi:MAG: hypothetical protein PF450_09815 [Bacteroidales bacterium]|nr:hypothetical protein [Bacteroidales bacterium]